MLAWFSTGTKYFQGEKNWFKNYRAVLSHFSSVQLFVTYGLLSARLLCPWDSQGKNTDVGCHALLQGIFPSQESNPYLQHLPLGRQVLYPLSHLGSPKIMVTGEPLKFLSCVRLCDSMDYSLPGSSIHGIFQVRVWEWATISFSRGSSGPGDWTKVSCIAADALPSEPLGKPPNYGRIILLTF